MVHRTSELYVIATNGIATNGLAELKQAKNKDNGQAAEANLSPTALWSQSRGRIGRAEFPYSAGEPIEGGFGAVWWAFAGPQRAN